MLFYCVLHPVLVKIFCIGNEEIPSNASFRLDKPMLMSYQYIRFRISRFASVW